MVALRAVEAVADPPGVRVVVRDAGVGPGVVDDRHAGHVRHLVDHAGAVGVGDRAVVAGQALGRRVEVDVAAADRRVEVDELRRA